MSKDRSEHYAFAQGYYDARAEGMEFNPYLSEEQAVLHTAYREGYDRGIADYCAEHHPEEVNK